MTTHNAAAYPATSRLTDRPPVLERRSEARQPMVCDLWMIDHHGSTVLRCRCIEISENGMRLRVPLGYGVAEGQRYELRSHPPGAHTPPPPLGLVSSRWATVVRTQLLLGENEDYLDIGVVLDHSEAVWPRTVH